MNTINYSKIEGQKPVVRLPLSDKLYHDIIQTPNGLILVGENLVELCSVEKLLVVGWDTEGQKARVEQKRQERANERKARYGNDHESPVWLIFEGVCPHCFHDVYKRDGGHINEFSIWGERLQWSEFKCVGCKKDLYVEETRDGDWVGGN